MDSIPARTPQASARSGSTAGDAGGRALTTWRPSGADLPPLGKELRESALLLGLMLVVVGLAAALASASLLLG